jgi:hypothetical protein
MRFPQPSRYIKKEQVQATPETQAPATPLNNVTTQAGIQQQLQTDGGQGMMESLGVPTEGVDPAQLQSLLGAAVNDSTTGPVSGDPSTGGGLDFNGGIPTQ